VNDLRSVSALVTLRDCRDADIAPISAIYGHYVDTSLATFEEVAPSLEEMAQRYTSVCAAGLPFIVATDQRGTVLGFAYAAPYRARSAYRFTVEDSIYVSPDATRRGIGRSLLAALIERCAAAGSRQMVAVIGDSANAASIALHAKMGFAHIGLMPAVGFKNGRWIDCIMMQRALGSGASTPPL
jgi:phosphinothricin acetyltransferase